MPADTCTLSGSAYDADNNIVSYLWTKISGPTLVLIETPNSLKTKVSVLQNGTYQFELMITDQGGLSDKDTVTVFVRELAPAGHGEIIFKDLLWMCPMGCSLLINCLYCFIPPGNSFNVYLKKTNSNVWIQVPHESQWTTEKYVYSIYNNTLWI